MGIKSTICTHKKGAKRMHLQAKCNYKSKICKKLSTQEDLMPYLPCTLTVTPNKLVALLGTQRASNLLALCTYVQVGASQVDLFDIESQSFANKAVCKALQEDLFGMTRKEHHVQLLALASHAWGTSAKASRFVRHHVVQIVGASCEQIYDLYPTPMPCP